MSRFERGDLDAAFAALEAIQPNATGNGDPESAHGNADDVLLAYVPKVLADAYERVGNRAGDWWYA